MLASLLVLGDLRSIPHSIPVGQEKAATVPLFNVWIIGWNAKALGRGQASYWHAPIFYPESGAFSFSEPQPTTLLVAPLQGWPSAPALAYNVYLLVSLGLAAAFTRRLLRDVGHFQLPALVGAVLILLLPFLHRHMGVLQLTTLWGPIGLIWSMVRFAQKTTAARAIVVGVAFAATYAACNYYGLFMALLSPLLLILVMPNLRRDTLIRLGLSCMVASGLLAPIWWGQVCWLGRQQPRDIELISELSARPADFLVSESARIPWLDSGWLIAADATGPFALGVGIPLMILALFGTVVALGDCWRGNAEDRLAHRRFWLMFCLALACGAGMLALGPRLGFAGVAPYHWLLEHVPYLNFIRSPYRIGVLFQIAVVFLAVEAVTYCCRPHEIAAIPPTQPSQTSGGRTRPLTGTIRILVHGLVALSIVHLWPPSAQMHDLRQYDGQAAWIRWLRDETSPAAVVACLPFPQRGATADDEPTLAWMLAALGHKRALVNGYSGFFPHRFRVLSGAMRSFPDPGSVLELQNRRVQYVVMTKQEWGRIRKTADTVPLTIVFEDTSARIVVCRLDRRGHSDE